MKREKLLQSPDYWFEHAQNELYGQVFEYMQKEKINQSELASRLGVTKGYVSQVLNGNFNYTLKKLIELSLAIGRVPMINYRPVEELVRVESLYQELMPHKKAGKSSAAPPEVSLHLIVESSMGEFSNAKQQLG